MSERISGIDVERALVRAKEVGAPVDLVTKHTQNNRKCYVLSIGPSHRTIVGARETHDVITAITATTLALTKPKSELIRERLMAGDTEGAFRLRSVQREGIDYDLVPSGDGVTHDILPHSDLLDVAHAVGVVRP